MTNQERIDALPIWHRIQFDNAVATKMRENWITRNTTAVAAILDEVQSAPDPWGMTPVEPVAEQPEPGQEEPAAPVEDDSDGPGDDQ